jgi:hypothetical protein
MYVTQAVACTVPNSADPISPAALADSAARVAAQDAQQAALLQNWITMLDRTPESFAALGIAPSQFVQPQSAKDILNLDSRNDLTATMARFRAGKRCNPTGDGPQVIPLSGFGDPLPLNEPLDLMAKGPLGRPQGKATGMGCHCGGTCGGCGTKGMGDFTGPGSGVLWGSIAAAGFLLYAAFGNTKRTRRK